jgi:quercetin dioxygenase-like cupin family protein
MTTAMNQTIAGAATPLERLARVVETNQMKLNWETILPQLGNQSPRSAILRFDPLRGATTFLTLFPVGLHIPRHSHRRAETTFVLSGVQTFEDANGARFEIRDGKHFSVPANSIHQTWAAAGTVTLSVLEDGLRADWPDGPPTISDIGKSAPVR